ncbi:MAG: hypothetical protein ABIS23_03615 [Sphingomicrobium sp.]
MSAFLLLAAALAAVSSVTDPRDSYPAPSPDGSQFLFQSTRSGKQAIWIAKSDGSSPRLLIDGGELGQEPATPSWSPDGTRFVFAMRPANAALEEESEIYGAAADGSNIRRLTSAPGDDSHPHWSADGRRIYFNSARATPDLKVDWVKQWIDIFSMSADGGDVRRITDCRTTCTYPVPSPDGRWIVHRKTFDGPGLDWALKPIIRNSEVVLTSVDGKITRNLTNSPAYDGWPVWTSSGWVLFSSNRDGVPMVGQVYAIRPDGSELQALTGGTLSRIQPTPSRDSRQLYVAEHVNGESGEFGHIVVVPLDLP